CSSPSPYVSLCPTFSIPFSCPHLDLLSFPTRRSSDLRTNAMMERTSEAAFFHRISTEWYSSDTPSAWVSLEPSLELPLLESSPRSEEHTSELQSRFDLVCRLLLEKKK